MNIVAAGNQSDVAVTATAGGGYLGAWSLGSAYVRGRYVAADGTPGLEDPLTTTVQGNQFDASMALLGNGRNVVTFTDGSSGTDTVRIRILGENAVGNDVDFTVPSDTRPLRESDVTALGSDGFAVAYTRDYGGGDTDVSFSGTRRTATRSAGRSPSTAAPASPPTMPRSPASPPAASSWPGSSPRPPAATIPSGFSSTIQRALP